MLQRRRSEEPLRLADRARTSATAPVVPYATKILTPAKRRSNGFTKTSQRKMTIAEDLASLPTPALVIDAAKVRANINRLAEYAATQSIKIRPHTKTHKLRRIARMQVAAGAIGIAVAKVTEAEAISDAGQDVLVAYPPLGVGRADRLAALAHDRIMRAAVDSLAAIETTAAAAKAAGTTVGLLVDLDVGLGRTGVASPSDTIPLAQAIDRHPSLRLDGLMIYPGQVWSKPNEQAAELKAVDHLVAETLALWKKHGLHAAIVSGGSTATAYQTHLMPHVTEMRPGTYVFNDMNTVRPGFASIEDCAARVVTTVISDAVQGQVVVDAGSKTLARDASSVPDGGFGHVVEYPQARIKQLSEEHGQIDVRACERLPRLGERITIIPNHICPCVNLHGAVWWMEPDQPLEQIAVDARGCIR
jgi:D-serine deaminase-like pyridoxal phosphate-dependent protein